MTVTTHSPETNLFYQFQRVTNGSQPEPELGETMYGVFMMLVCPEGGDDKSSQTNFYDYLLFFIQTGTQWLLISYKMSEGLDVPNGESCNKHDRDRNEHESEISRKSVEL